MNQGIFTVMSYNRGWSSVSDTDPSQFGTQLGSYDFGIEGAPMALDIAYLQLIYGSNEDFNVSDSTYYLSDSAIPGASFVSIWDAGGIHDAIVYVGTRAAHIDLRAATLAYAEGGGGYISYVEGASGVFSGFTIANGVVIENATGGSGSDSIVGNSQANTLNGAGGDDALNGGSGDDTIDGGDGIDAANFSGLRSAYVLTVLAGNGVQVVGPDGIDILINVETLIFADQSFTWSLPQLKFSGSPGNDTLVGNELDNEVDGFDGDDYLVGGAGNDDLRGGNGNDLLFGNDGNDLLVGGAGADVFTGGPGRDEVAYQTSTAGVSVDLATGTGTGDAAGDIFGSIENLIGSCFDDYLSGDNADNYLYGLDGNDNLRGDTGDDLLIGGLGADALSGGSGNDTASYHNADDSIRVVLFQNIGRYHDAEGDTFGSIENVNGSQYSDEIFGDHAANVLWGNGGHDTLEGDGGNDRLEGGEGFDKLYGQDGNDTLIGGAGQDRLFGGAGADTFVFIVLTDSTPGAEDEVVEFTREHGDLIDLSMIDANNLVGGDQAFAFIGTAAFNGTASQLHYVSGRFLEGDVDGNGTADFRIQFNNSSLQSSDFIL